MNFKDLLEKILGKGFATAKEKTTVQTLFETLEKSEQETYKKDVEAVDALPEDEPKGDEKELEKNIEKLLGKATKGVTAELRKEMSEAMEKSIEKAVAEHLALKEKKAGVYNQEVQKDQKRKEMSDYLRKFSKALFNNDVVQLKELTTDATGSPYGGYVVDSELSAEIRALVTEYGVSRREMERVTLSKDSYKANSLVTDVTVTWEDEGATINSTQVVLGQTTLELKKLAAIVSMTSELLEDQEIDLFSFVAQRVAQGFAQKEDEAFFKGDGTSTYGSFTGLLNNTSINEVTMTGTSILGMDADDLISMVDATPQGALANAKFYMHRSLMSLVRKLKDDNGLYIYQMPSVTGPATIWGYPVVLVEAMPSTTDNAADTSFVLFGDMRKACIHGSKASGLKAKRFDTGTVPDVAGTGTINLLSSDREAIRWTMRVGYIVILATAMTKLTTASSST